MAAHTISLNSGQILAIYHSDSTHLKIDIEDASGNVMHELYLNESEKQKLIDILANTTLSVCKIEKAVKEMQDVVANLSYAINDVDGSLGDIEVTLNEIRKQI